MIDWDEVRYFLAVGRGGLHASRDGAGNGYPQTSTRPPSTKSSPPVMYDASSEPRNSAAEATYSAWPILASGTIC